MEVADEVALSRREFLTLSLVGLLSPWVGLLSPWEVRAGAPARVTVPYTVEAGVLFQWIKYRMDGLLEERIDRTAGTYRLAASGAGEGIAQRIESSGVIRDGRFWPMATRSFFLIRGRESRVTIDYDYDRLRADYHHVSHTFFLGRRRAGDDILALPSGLRIDDVATMYLNYLEEKMESSEGSFLTHIIRRARAESEGVDEVQPGGYRAQIVPLNFRVESDPATGPRAALLDLARFSSWATSKRPARIVFGPDRRLNSIEAHLIFGTKFQVLFGPEHAQLLGRSGSGQEWGTIIPDGQAISGRPGRAAGSLAPPRTPDTALRPGPRAHPGGA